MPKLKFLTISIILVILISLAGPSFKVSASPLAAVSPTLGAAGSYSVLAGTTVTNTGNTTMPGDLGVSPGTAIVGFPPGIVNPPGTQHSADANAALAQLANTAAFGDLDQPCTTTYTGVQDLTLVSPLGPGVYCADAFILTKSLELTGTGVWIFKAATTLTTSANSSVTGGDPCNVWWRLGSSVTLLATGTKFIGNILALTSIALQNGATLNGKALAQTGAVTLDSNTITGETCLVQSAATPTASAATQTAAAALTATAAAGTPTATAAAGTPTATAAAGTPTATAAAATQTATAEAAALTATAAAATPTATAPTATPVPPTATKLPVVTALPGTGGAPIQNEDFPWTLVIAGGFSAIALFLGIRAYRSTYRPNQ
jgi:hypothetical protein